MPDDPARWPFHTRHRFGGSESDPPLESLAALLDEVDEDPADVEHRGVASSPSRGSARRRADVPQRIVTELGDQQIALDEPSGNAIELVQPAGR
jgi:hypothetical protein